MLCYDTSLTLIVCFLFPIASLELPVLLNKFVYNIFKTYFESHDWREKECWANEIMVYHHCYPHQKWYTKYNTYTSHKSFLHHLGHLTWYFKLLAPSLTSPHLCHTSVVPKKDSLVEPKVHASSTLIW